MAFSLSVVAAVCLWKGDARFHSIEAELAAASRRIDAIERRESQTRQRLEIVLAASSQAASRHCDVCGFDQSERGSTVDAATSDESHESTKATSKQTERIEIATLRRFYEELDEQVDDVPADPAWHPEEVLVGHIQKNIPDARVLDVDCSSHTCRVELYGPSDQDVVKLARSESSSPMFTNGLAIRRDERDASRVAIYLAREGYRLGK